MTYAKIENNRIVEYPVFEGDIRLRYPNVSFPAEFCPPEGYVFVAQTLMPPIEYDKNCIEGSPEKQGDSWVSTWEVVDASAEEIAVRLEAQWHSIRQQRDLRLRLSDWTQLPDAPVDAAAWTAYRQALRDVTNQADPFNIEWPTAPGA